MAVRHPAAPEAVVHRVREALHERQPATPSDDGRSPRDLTLSVAGALGCLALLVLVLVL